jgi:hypothetical protein
MSIAYFSTWTTYGTWLPGDERGWYQRGRGDQCPNPLREFESRLHMKGDAVIFSLQQRAIVEKTIADHCQHRGWTMYASVAERITFTPLSQRLAKTSMCLANNSKLGARGSWWSMSGN